jgi:hypothetical protein
MLLVFLIKYQTTYKNIYMNIIIIHFGNTENNISKNGNYQSLRIIISFKAHQ